MRNTMQDVGQVVFQNTGGQWYVDLVYLENTTYDEVIFISVSFSTKFYSNSTLPRWKSLKMKKELS